MLNGPERDRLDKLLEDNMITGIQYETIANAPEKDAGSIIISFVAEKVVISQHERVSRLTDIIKEAVIHKALEALRPDVEMNLSEIFDLWEEILNIIGKNQEYGVSIVLDESTYRMINEFVSSRAISESLNTVHPLVSTVLIVVGEEPRESIIEELKRIPGLSLTYDPQEFIEKAEGTIVLCNNVDSTNSVIIDLISGVLERGIFLTVPTLGSMDLNTVSRIADAINRSQIPDGTGVLHLEGKLIHKPYNPLIKLGSDCNCSPVTSVMGMSMPADVINVLRTIGL